MPFAKENFPQESLAAAMYGYHTSTLQPLVPLSALDVLSTIGRYLPLSLSSLWGYELPLHTSKPEVDLLVCIHLPTFFLNALNNSEFFRESFHTNLQQFAERWANKEDKLSRLVNNIWVEYDFNTLKAGHLTPNFFFGPRKQSFVFDTVWATREIFQLLSGAQVHEKTYRFLLDCLLTTSQGSWISQIGKMLARPGNSLRLFVQQVPQQGLLPLLQTINYPHYQHSSLVNLIDTCYQLASNVELDIDITDCVGDQIGLECYFDNTVQVLQFLHELHTQGLCVTEKFTSLREHLLQITYNADQPFIHFFSHFKLGFHPVNGITTKAYLGYTEQSVARKVIRTKPLT